MARVDASRFLSQVATLFAPNIQDGQVFLAFIDEDNSFTVQTDNIIRSSGSSVNIDVDQDELAELKAQANRLERFCNDITALQTQIQTLSGSTDGEGSVDFNYAYCIDLILEMRSEVDKLSAQVEALKLQLNSIIVSENNYDIS